MKSARPVQNLVGLFSSALLVAGGTLLISAPSAAASTEVSMNKLIDRGYECGRAGIFGWKCTKEGSPPYLCNNAKWCIPDPTVVTSEL